MENSEAIISLKLEPSTSHRLGLVDPDWAGGLDWQTDTNLCFLTRLTSQWSCVKTSSASFSL